MEERNPYAAPGAKVSDPAPRPGSPYKAVGLGLLADFGGTIAFSLLLGFAYAVFLAGSGLPPEEIQQALENARADSWYFWAGTLGGAGFSVLGGYVCARIARQSEYTLGVILAAAGVILGMLIGGSDEDLGTTIVLYAASAASVILGAWIGKKHNRAARLPVPPGQ